MKELNLVVMVKCPMAGTMQETSECEGCEFCEEYMAEYVSCSYEEEGA